MNAGQRQGAVMTNFYIEYEINGKTYREENKSSVVSAEFDGERLRAFINAAKPTRVKKFYVQLPQKYERGMRCFVNGYQSWTDSKEFDIDGKMDTLTRLAEFSYKNAFMINSGLGRAGDSFYYEYPRKKGVFYGYSYAYLRKDDEVKLFASLSENEGFTIIRFDAAQGYVRLEKDLEGALINGKTLVADIAVLKGGYDEVFDKWFELNGVQCRTKERKCGYTTWYNYYGGITQSIVERDLKALSELPQKPDIFQIDDGHQKCIGEWLNTDKAKFPSGMKAAADKIYAAGMQAGLWLAPFAAVKDSFIYREHRDWLVKGKNGKPYPAGPNWGTFYAIDFYNKEAAAYIKKVFNVVLNEWGYDMVKLDFLYAACVVPMHGKSRGRIMCEAMDFIRECVGDKLILGCGVPLMPAFGKVDFCRIGADVALDWHFRKHMIREDVSTPNTVCCTIFRRGLNGRAFLNDPDVFLLRDKNMHMSFEKRKLLAKINGMFGDLLFVSDNVSEYGKEQREVFFDTVRKKNVRILRAGISGGDIMRVDYEEEGQAKSFSFNYKTGETL